MRRDSRLNGSSDRRGACCSRTRRVGRTGLCPSRARGVVPDPKRLRGRLRLESKNAKSFETKGISVELVPGAFSVCAAAAYPGSDRAWPYRDLSNESRGPRLRTGASPYRPSSITGSRPPRRYAKRRPAALLAPADMLVLLGDIF